MQVLQGLFFFPHFSWQGDILREKLSETGIIPFNKNGSNATGANASLPATGGVSSIPVYFTQWETELTLNYDFDLWGKNRNQLKAQIGQMLAEMADTAFSRLQLSTRVAQVYFQLQVDYKREEIAKRLVENRQKYQELRESLLQGNLNQKLDFHTSQSNVADTKQLLLQIQGDIAVNEYLLKSLLAGNFEEEIINTRILEQPLPKVPLPLDIPLHLISGRPDIIAQLWIIESAGKQIEVAKAGFYPDFNLSALFGFQTIHLSELFFWKSSYGNIDPAFSLPIFDGGKLMANLRNSEVNYDLAIFQYDQLVLNAAREVLESLALVRNFHAQWQEYQNKADLLDKNVQLTELLLHNNISSGLDYLTSEETMLQAQDQKMIALGNTIQAILSLIKALGGGYDTSC